MKKALLLMVLLYPFLLLPFTSYMKGKPFIEKVGYVPKADIMRLTTSEYREAISASLILKVMVYFGGVVEMFKNRIMVPTDYRGMYDMIETALRLDPYNMDGYYFTQAIFVWDVGQARLVNELLEYGMRYRDWDFYLPFFAGFNYAYFLKDYGKAAEYYKKAAVLSRSDLFIKLAGRYLYEAGKTEHAIAYISIMVEGTKDRAVKESLQVRLQAFKEVKGIEDAIEGYRKDKGNPPSSVEELIDKGYLKERPVDPYGGRFYIDEDGRVRTTSRFAFGIAESKKQ